MKNLFLIDANSIIHRSFHALPPLNASDGSVVNAIYGLSSILLKLWREDKPDYAAALFDRPEPTFRKEKFKEYKAQRPAAPSELISQIIEAHHVFESFGITTFEKPGFEADDLIATLAEIFKTNSELKITILTGDMDTLQLVDGEHVVVRAFKKGITETVTYDDKTVHERYGLKPNQVIDYKALVGDPSDNIKGVPGIGPKTATEVLQQFGNVENLYKELDGNIKLKNRFGPFREEAMLSKNLVTLKRDVPVEVESIADLAVGADAAKIKNYFEKMGFKTLIMRLNGENSSNNATKPSKPKKRDQSLL